MLSFSLERAAVLAMLFISSISSQAVWAKPASAASPAAAAASTAEDCERAAARLGETLRGERTLQALAPSVLGPAVGKTITGHPGCMVTLSGWWTYEFCLGSYIRQFHVEGDTIHDEYFIGLTPARPEPAAADTAAAASASARAPTPLSVPLQYRDGRRTLQEVLRLGKYPIPSAADTDHPYYAPYCPANAQSLLISPSGATVNMVYDSGTMCGLTEKRRKATVFFYCDAMPPPPPGHEHVKLPIFFDISEVSPCEYAVHVRGPLVCVFMNKQPPVFTATFSSGGGGGGHASPSHAHEEPTHTHPPPTPLKDVPSASSESDSNPKTIEEEVERSNKYAAEVLAEALREAVILQEWAKSLVFAL